MFLGRTPCVRPSDVLHPGHLPPASTALVPHPSRKHDLRAAPAGSGLPPVAVTGRRRPGLSSIGFWGKGRQRQELAAMLMRKCMSSLILKEKAHVLPRSIIGMETGSVKGLCPLEQSADLWISALELRHRACRAQRDQ